MKEQNLFTKGRLDVLEVQDFLSLDGKGKTISTCDET